jgi:dipeptidyl aminopeptidase/acylaminoacyl peptidase
MFGPANLTSYASYSTPKKVFGNNQSNLVLANPTNYVKANVPPILIIQGVDDKTVPESQSVELCDKLTEAGDQTQLVLVQNMGHMFIQAGSEPINPSLAQIAQDMVSFLEKYRAGG